MKHTIVYKHIKHGYARVLDDGSVRITIPTRLRYNKKFEKELIEKAQTLVEKQKKRTVFMTSGEDFLVIFWEQVPLSEFKSKSQRTLDKKLKTILHDYAQPLLDEMSTALKKKYQELRVRKLKAKWGSCSYDQKIVLNQNLVHLPTKYVKYVVIHEACHLKVKNHSKKFWDVVIRYCPEYKNLRKEMSNLIVKSL